jgi:hypothetical protein
MTTGKRQIKGDDAAEIQRREKALESELEDSFLASGLIAAARPAPSPPDHLLIRKHDKSEIVELSTMVLDGRIWPGDLPTTLQWLPTTELVLSQTEDDFCSHILSINQTDPESA